ncbi:MAG: FlgD immunoglobulin-like domain containing protein [Candidatus Zixiibacteriota bacterium]
MTYDNLPNELLKLYIDDNDKLYLFYLEGVRDTITGFVYDYRILYKTKAKNGNWSLPEEIQTPTYIFGQNHKAGLWMDTKTGIIHLLYTNYSWTNLNYTNSTIPNWESVTIDSLIGQNAQCENFAMSFDTIGNVHIAWHVDFDSIGAEWYRVMYTNNSAGYWVKQQVSPSIFLGGMGSGDAKLSVQKNGAAHILYEVDPYCDSDCNGLYVRNDSLNSTNWITDTLPKPSRPLWYYGGYYINVDTNNKVHLITMGCIEEDCLGTWSSRAFYYQKDSDDSLWTAPEVILDSLFYLSTEFVDNESVPYLVEWDPSTYCRFFTGRKQSFWEQPYRILDTTALCNVFTSYYPQGFLFVLDSEGQGHAAFAGSLLEFLSQNDSLEIFYYGPPLSSVEDTLREHREFSFQLSQNYPNLFNSTTIIRYSLNAIQPIQITLTLYNILGEEVRELVNTRQSKGNYRVSWDGKNDSGKEVSSGIYFYELKAGEYKETRKLVLIK